MTDILLSVRPRYARALLAGTKTVEVRRRFPDQPSGATLFVYSSTPDRAVLGTVRLESIERPKSHDVWHLYRHEMLIGRDAVADYLTETDSAAILRVTHPHRWPHAVSLAILRRALQLEPPQSFRYLSPDQVADLEQLRERDDRSLVASLAAGI